MAHVEFDWIARHPFRAEHPPGSGTVVEYEPGDRVPANDWGQAAHHLEGNDKIMRVAINVADPGDDVAGAREPGPPSRGLTDPTHQFLAYEGQSPIAEEEPALEPADGEEVEDVGGVPEDAGAVAGEGSEDELDESSEVEVDDGDPEDVVTDAAGFPRHTGGGVYELSDGSTVRGKRRAEAAQVAIDESGS